MCMMLNYLLMFYLFIWSIIYLWTTRRMNSLLFLSVILFYSQLAFPLPPVPFSLLFPTLLLPSSFFFSRLLSFLILSSTLFSSLLLFSLLFFFLLLLSYFSLSSSYLAYFSFSSFNFSTLISFSLIFIFSSLTFSPFYSILFYSSINSLICCKHVSKISVLDKWDFIAQFLVFFSQN